MESVGCYYDQVKEELRKTNGYNDLKEAYNKDCKRNNAAEKQTKLLVLAAVIHWLLFRKAYDCNTISSEGFFCYSVNGGQAILADIFSDLQNYYFNSI